MKKILAAVTALFVTVFMSVTAFAADGGSVTGMGTGEKTIDVMASYKPSDSTEKVYRVDITWEDMSFTYTEDARPVWDPETHTYSTVSEGKWDKTAANITVTNHSDAAVEVTITYTPSADTGVTGKITNGKATLQADKAGEAKAADSLTATLHIGGIPNGSVTEAGVKIGTITIQIS